jgi:nucleoside-diphosphate-sugar epimerase
MLGILVTGASGFLGRALCAQLAATALPFVAASRQARAGWVAVDDYGNCPASSVTVHAAEEPDRAKVNALGMTYHEHSADVVRKLLASTSSLVYISSSMVYGDSSEEPYAVSAPVHASDPYSQGKLHNEKLVLEAGGTVLRLSNLFGHGMSPHNVLSDIARQFPGVGPLQVRDDRPVRDFLAVEEAAQAIVLGIQCGLRGVVNIGSGAGVSTREVARIALRAVGQPGRPIVSSQIGGRRSVNILDISQTRQRLGWQPTAPEEALGQFFLNGACF